MFNLLWLTLYCVYAIYGTGVDGACERSAKILGAEDICWTAKVKIADRIQYTTKSVLNFAKEKLGIGSEEPFYPQQCDYYQCIFNELKMLSSNGYPNYQKIVEYIDNNIIYNHAKAQYDRLTQCNTALNNCIASNTYFSGDLALLGGMGMETPELQDKCEISNEFMKCLAINGTECIVFVYP